MTSPTDREIEEVRIAIAYALAALLVDHVAYLARGEVRGAVAAARIASALEAEAASVWFAP